MGRRSVRCQSQSIAHPVLICWSVRAPVCRVSVRSLCAAASDVKHRVASKCQFGGPSVRVSDTEHRGVGL